MDWHADSFIMTFGLDQCHTGRQSESFCGGMVGFSSPALEEHGWRKPCIPKALQRSLGKVKHHEVATGGLCNLTYFGGPSMRTGQLLVDVIQFLLF